MKLVCYKSVQIWLKELRDRYKDPNEINLRLELLKKFCDVVARNPDELIKEVYNFNSNPPPSAFYCEALLIDYASPTILKKRDYYNAKINEFIDGLDEIPSIKDTYGNMLEGFFIYNGIKMYRKHRVWIHPGGVSPE